MGATMETKPSVREFPSFDPTPDVIQIYDAHKHGRSPIIIDNGAYECRAGWGNARDPSLVFKNRVARTKAMRGEPATMLVGNDIKESEASRWALRPFREQGLVTTYAAQEEVLDYIFEHLGLSGAAVGHDVVMTEPVCNPNYCRSRMSELMFECYGAPAVAYGVDAMFSFHHASRVQKLNGKHGLVISAGHAATHVIPVVNGRMDAAHAKRLDIGGEALSQFLANILKFSHPHLTQQVTQPQIQAMLHGSALVPENYGEAMRLWSDPQYRMDNTHTYQLPFVRPDPITEEEKRRRRQEQGERLREFMRRKREKEIAALQEKRAQLESIKDYGLGKKATIECRKLGFKNLEELEIEIDAISDKIRIKTNQMLGIKEEIQEPPKKEVVFDLLDKDDKDLTDEQKKEKKKQRFLKNAEEGRRRAREERQRLQQEKEEQERLEEEARRRDPEKWLNELRTRKAELEKQRAMKSKRKVDLQNRRSAAFKQRMRLVMQQANEDEMSRSSKRGGRGRRGNKEDDFGIDDAHWDVYRVIGKDEDSQDEREEEELAVIEQQLAEHDPDYVGGEAPVDIEAFHQMRVGVERVRVPELLFQPGMVGDMSAGLANTIHWVLSRYYTPEVQAEMSKNICVTGGLAHIPGFTDRLAAEIRAVRPFGSDVFVYRAADPSLDAWRGAEEWAQSVMAKHHGNLTSVAVTRHDYDEKGAEYLKEHECSNHYVPTPQK